MSAECRPCEIERKRRAGLNAPGYPVDFPCQHGGVMAGLSAADLALMAAHAVTPETMAQAGAQSSDTGLWWTWAGDGGSIRVSRVPDSQRETKKRKYTSAGQWPGGTTFPAMFRETGAPRLLIAEGHLKYLAAASWAPDGTDVWGMVGCDGIHRKTDLAKAAGRDVVLVLDADRHTNPDVAAAAARVTGHLRKAGARSVRLADVPAVAGEHTGLDDWLASLPEAGRTAALAALLDGSGEAPASALDSAGEIMPPPAAPLEVARRIAEDYAHPDGTPVRRKWRGDWLTWGGTHYAETEAGEMRKLLYERLEKASYAVPVKDGLDALMPWNPTPYRVSSVLDALSAVLYLDGSTSGPAWLDGGTRDGISIPVANGLLVRTADGARVMYRHTPLFFSRMCSPFSYDAHAPEPAEWLRFLGALWPDDPDSIATLQEWFGYILSGRTDLHKMLMVVGPARGGKGTIARVLEALAGPDNCAAPILASLGRPFGLQPLIGKTLAVVADVRLGPKTDLSVLAERLLAISGGDSLDAECKHEGKPVTGRLPVRFMMLSNELPSFSDVSGALATRFVVLTLTRSWLRNEDLGLYDRIAREMPGILNWALDGLDRLARNGRMTEPESSRDAVIALHDAVSPHSAFVRDRCSTGAGLEVPVSQLYAAYQGWCMHESGRTHVESLQQFSKNLRAVIPGLKSVRPRAAAEDASRPRVFYGVALKPVAQPGRQPVQTPENGSGPRWSADYLTARVNEKGSLEAGGTSSSSGNGADRGPARTSGPPPGSTPAQPPPGQPGPDADQVARMREAAARFVPRLVPGCPGCDSSVAGCREHVYGDRRG